MPTEVLPDAEPAKGFLRTLRGRGILPTADERSGRLNPGKTIVDDVPDSEAAIFFWNGLCNFEGL